MRRPLTALSVVAFSLSSPACHQTPEGKSNPPPIVGAWFVKIPEAPFQYHMFVFNSDGTLQQTNPDAGDPNTSDSNGLGVWLPDGDRIRGKFVEVTADRTTRQFVSRGEISFLIKVSGNGFGGTASATFYDAEGRRIKGPLGGHTARAACCPLAVPLHARVHRSKPNNRQYSYGLPERFRR